MNSEQTILYFSRYYSACKDLPLLLRDLGSRRIIRTLKAGEKTQYENSHDVLALVVGQNLTKEIQLREEAVGVYKVYEGKKGYLTPEDLDHIRPYQQYRPVSGVLQKKVEESVAFNAKKEVEKLEEVQRQAEQERMLRRKAEEKEKQARQRTNLAVVFSIIALALALFAVWSYFQAQAALAKLEKANASTVSLLLKEANRNILNLRYEEALEKIKASARFNTLKDSVAQSWLEIAFWHTETGDSLRAQALLDSIASFAGMDISRSKPLRENMKVIDPAHYKYLFESKYYPEMVLVEGGTFWMGCNKKIDLICVGDATLHQQEISSFRISKYETTVWQFALFCAATGEKINDFLVSTWTDPGNNPVVYVSWYDAVKYANWVSKEKGYSEAILKDDSGNLIIDRESKGYRLPTEAEWEYAAKGGKHQSPFIYSGHPELDTVGWYVKNSGSRTRPVGKKKANALGLYDMSGNVWEWCWDWYDGYPGSLDMKDYSGPYRGSYRIVRGGCWKSQGYECLVSLRDDLYPGRRLNDNGGFRLSRAL